MAMETICLIGMSYPLRYLADVLLAPNADSLPVVAISFTRSRALA